MSMQPATRLDPGIIDELRGQLAGLAVQRRLQQVAKVSGLSYSWVHDFAKGNCPNPGIRSLHRLALALASIQQDDVA